MPNAYPNYEEEDIPTPEEATGNAPMSPKYLAMGYPDQYAARHPDAPPPMLAAAGNAPPGGEAAATLPELGAPREPQVVTTTNAAGQPMQVALAGLSPEAQQRYAALGGPGGDYRESIRIAGPVNVGDPANMPRYSGMGELRGIEARSNRMDAENARSIADAAEEQKRAIKAQSEVAQTRATEEYAVQSQAQDQARKLEADNQTWQANHTTALQHAETAYNDAVTSQKNMTFDPDRFMKNMSVGTSLQSALSVALGGMGQAMIPGSRNVGLDQLNRAVEADVAQQQEVYRRAGNNVAAADNAYSRLRQQGVDHEHALAGAKNAVWEQAKTGLGVLGAKYRTPELVANAQAAMAQINQEQAKNKQVFDQGAVARAASFANARHAERQFMFAQDQAAWGRGQQQMSMELSERAAQQKALSSGKDREIEGWTGGAKTDAMYNKATEMVGTYQTLAPLFDKMAQWRKQHSGGTVTNMGPAVAEAEAMHSEALMEVKNLAELGVLSGNDVELVTKQIGPPPHAFFTSDKAYAARMEEAQRFLKQKTEGKMKAWGYHPTDAANPIAPLRGGNMQPD